MDDFTVLNLLTREIHTRYELDVVCIAGQSGINRKITKSINRPGLALNEHFIEFGENRIQLFGHGEGNFLHKLESENKLDSVLKQFFSYPIACCIFSHSKTNKPPQRLVDFCEKEQCPLLLSELSSADLSSNIYLLLNDLYAPQECVHGVFLEVHDLGVLLLGESGIGKSELALELIEKNKYRLIADDAIIIKRINDRTLIGTSVDQKQYQHNLEIRGLGFVNIAQIHGIGTTLKSKRIDLVVELQPWDDSIQSDLERLEHNKTTRVLDVELPHVILQVKAGRNVSLLIETAAIKHRLISMGYHGKENPYLW